MISFTSKALLIFPHLHIASVRASLEGDSRLPSLWLSVLTSTERHETRLFITATPQSCAMMLGHSWLPECCFTETEQQGHSHLGSGTLMKSQGLEKSPPPPPQEKGAEEWGGGDANPKRRENQWEMREECKATRRKWGTRRTVRQRAGKKRSKI